MNLRDGTPFKLGMLVVFETGREVQTDEESFELVPCLFEGKTTMNLGRKGGCSDVDLALLYPSQAARIADQVKMLEKLKRCIDEDIAYLQADGDPTATMLKHIR